MATRHAVVAGASGFIGRALVAELLATGWTVTRLVRRDAQTADEVRWTPGSTLDPEVVSGVDAVINLAGSSIARMPWTATIKRDILESRESSTSTLVDAINAAAAPPAVFLCASAVGIYGDRGDDELTESSVRGEGFLADVVDTWESNASRATTRTVTIRSGLVLGDGGALAPLRLATSLFLGARVGSGRQWWPWVSLHDEVRAIIHCLTAAISGPVNVVGPTPATANSVTRALARALGRPHVLVIPAFAIRLLGDAGRELLLWSQKVRPTALDESGFRFDHPTVDDAIRSVIGEKRP